MDEASLTKLLKEVRAGKASVAQAVRTLKDLPFASLGYATVDTSRQLRQGFPEVIFGQTKSVGQIAGILRELRRHGQRVLVTRLSDEKGESLSRLFPEGRHDPVARIFVAGKPMPPAGSVAVVTAGTSDIPVAEEAAVTAEAMGARVSRIFDVGVAGLHRVLRRREEIARADAVVVVAGMEGALASVVGGLVPAPVVAVPTSIGYGASYGGLTALLSMMLSCAPNVAVVNIDNGFGAGFYATLISRSRRGQPRPAGGRRRRAGK